MSGGYNFGPWQQQGGQLPPPQQQQPQQQYLPQQQQQYYQQGGYAGQQQGPPPPFGGGGQPLPQSVPWEKPQPPAAGVAPAANGGKPQVQSDFTKWAAAMGLTALAAAGAVAAIQPQMLIDSFDGIANAISSIGSAGMPFSSDGLNAFLTTFVAVGSSMAVSKAICMIATEIMQMAANVKLNNKSCLQLSSSVSQLVPILEQIQKELMDKLNTIW